MPRLFLIKHAKPKIVAEIPAKDWLLSDEGREASVRLAGILKTSDISWVVTSTEPKAQETGRILAVELGLPYSSEPDLHEHARASTLLIPDLHQWQALVQRFFAKPAELVFGEETADQAHSRFATALKAAMGKYPGQSLAVVAHGTVISLLVSRANDTDGFALWKRLGLPSVVEVEWPNLRLIRVIEEV